MCISFALPARLSLAPKSRFETPSGTPPSALPGISPTWGEIEQPPTSKLPIFPHVGELPGRAEGGASRRLLKSLLNATVILGCMTVPAFPQAPADVPFPASALPGLRALPALSAQLQFDGERATRTVQVFLGPSEARSGGELVLALQSGVSVMPEASTLSVSVNGRAAAALPLGGSRPPASVMLAPNLLRPGWNTITLLVSQRHRVDCRIQATYDLWTRIDPEHSGLRLANGTPPALSRVEDLPLLSRKPDGTLPVRIRLDGQNDGELAAAFTLAAVAAQAAGGSAVHVDARPEPLDGTGLEILAGSTARLTRLGVAANVVAAAKSGPQWIAPSGASSAKLIALVDSTRDAERAAAVLAGKFPAPEAGSATVENRTLRFSELGVETEEFSGRLFRAQMDLALPSDSLTADYGRVSLLLQAAYAAGLDYGSGLSVFVNDRLTATLPFGRSAGEEFKRREIGLPLSAFRPGINRVVLEARLPAEADEACEPATQIGGAPRFLLLGDSELSVPQLAHMARLPELASTVAAAPALARLDPTVRLALAGNDPDTVSAAGAFFVSSALAAGSVPPLEVGPVERREMRGVTVVGAAREIGSDLLEAAGLDAHAFLRATERSGEDDAAAKLDPLSTGSVLPAEDADESAAALKSWRMRAQETRSEDGWTTQALSGGLQAARAALGILPPPETPDLDEVKLVVSQAMSAGREGPLTVVTAFSRKDLSEGVDLLAQPERWKQLSGQSLFLDAEGKATALPARTVRFVPTEAGWSPGNMRLITAAWFSLNPPAYAGIVLLCALIFGALTHVLVRRSGVRA